MLLETPGDNKPPARKRRSRRRMTSAVLAACAVLAVVLSISPPLFGSGNGEPSSTEVPATTGSFTLSDGELTPTGSISDETLPSQVEEARFDQSDIVEVTTEDGIAAEHETGVVLARIPDGVSAEEFNASLDGLDFLAFHDVTEADVSLGWVELSLAAGENVPDAVKALEASGVVESVQPNYVYHLVDTESNDLVPWGVQGDLPPASQPTGVEHSTLNYYKFVNDPQARNQMSFSPYG